MGTGLGDPLGARILVVDDDDQVRQLLARHLIASGHDVVVAASGAEAIEIVGRDIVDLVLLDIMMPGLDGFETCRTIKAKHGIEQGPIVVFLTGMEDLDSHERAVEAGGDDFLLKPFRRGELLIRIRSLLRIRQLAHDVRDSTDVIRAQRDSLAILQKQKDALTSLVIHDLKNPLGTILFNAEYLQRDPTLPEALRSATLDIVSSTSSMQRMIANFLSLAAAEAGGHPPTLRLANLDDILEKAQKVAARRAQIRKIELGVSSELSQSTIKADADMLLRLIVSLLDNSLKYSPTGGKVRISARPTSEGHFLLRVDDDGPAIAPEFRDLVFDAYALVGPDGPTDDRASRSRNLAFAQLAAQVHGGRIWIEENSTHGNSFCVELLLAS
jgi:DNA-binding response OmpR family regulator